MLNIFHSPGTRGFRVIWACEELGVPYQVTPVDFSPAYRAKPEWREKNPVGKVPVMIDGDLMMFESGAMLQYVLDAYGNGRLQPTPGTPEHALYLQWCWFAEATFARPLGDIAQHMLIRPEKERIPAVVEDGRQRAGVCLDAVEAVVRHQDYLLDSFTAADIMMGYSLMLAERFGLLNEDFPATTAYFARLKARDGYQYAMRV